MGNEISVAATRKQKVEKHSKTISEFIGIVKRSHGYTFNMDSLGGDDLRTLDMVFNNPDIWDEETRELIERKSLLKSYDHLLESLMRKYAKIVIDTVKYDEGREPMEMMVAFEDMYLKNLKKGDRFYQWYDGFRDISATFHPIILKRLIDGESYDYNLNWINLKYVDNDARDKSSGIHRLSRIKLTDPNDALRMWSLAKGL